MVGLSAASLVADEELRKLATDPHAPDKSKPPSWSSPTPAVPRSTPTGSTRLWGYQYQTAPETKYNTVVVTAEYDGFADFPDRVWNIPAVANAYVGEILEPCPQRVHRPSKVDPSNITVTTNSPVADDELFHPIEHLPLVELLPFLVRRSKP